MSRSINFLSNIHTASHLKGQIKRKELNKINQYAKNTDSDIFIYRRLQTEDSVVFDTVISKNKRPIYFREFNINDDNKSYNCEHPTGILA